MNRSNAADSAGEPVDIEHVMQEVRREILDRKLPGQVRLPAAADSNQRPEYYEELFRAALAQSRLEVDLLVTPTRVPLIGPIVDALRRKFHELVVFYINRSSMNQAKVNHHVLAALSILGRAESAEPSGSIPIDEGRSGALDSHNSPVTFDDVCAGYRLFFGRDPNQSDRAYWIDRLASRQVTRTQLIDYFLRDYQPETTPDERLTSKGAPTSY
jgi:hypothetical protein